MRETFTPQGKIASHRFAAWRRLPNGCSNFAQMFLAAFAKPLLPAGRFISRKLKIKYMSTGWENVEPAPIEFLHGRLLDLFHEWRRSKTENTTVEIDGIAFNNIIAKAKTETYAKYHKQNLKKTIPKSEM